MIAVGLWGFVSLVIGTIVPAVYQQFFVQPNELAKEKPYIARNITATRAAFGLDDKHVRATRFDYKNNLTGQPISQDDSQTISNARLWDPSVIASNYQIFQSLQTYYRFPDADTDRYMIDGQQRQVLIAARELNSDDLPSQSWVNRHVVYTHGYGSVVSPANAASTDGQPNFLLSRHPAARASPRSSSTGPRCTSASSSTATRSSAPSSPSSTTPRKGRDVTTRYKGSDGVGLSSLVAARRVRAALQRPEPADLEPDHATRPRSCSGATSRTG